MPAIRDGINVTSDKLFFFLSIASIFEPIATTTSMISFVLGGATGASYISFDHWSIRRLSVSDECLIAIGLQIHLTS